MLIHMFCSAVGDIFVRLNTNVLEYYKSAVL